MAKGKNPETDQAAPTTEQVESGIKRVRRFHAYGWESLAARPDASKGSNQDEAAKRGDPKERLKRARAFAAKYGPADLDALCDLAREHRCVLSECFAYVLATVGDAAARSALQEEAVRGRWSMRRLGVEVWKRVPGRRRFGGRPHHKRETAGDAYHAISSLCRTWHNLAESLRKQPAEGATPQPPAPEQFRHFMPPNVREGLAAATAKVEELAKLLEDKAGKLGRSGSRVGAGRPTPRRG